MYQSFFLALLCGREVWGFKYYARLVINILMPTMLRILKRLSLLIINQYWE